MLGVRLPPPRCCARCRGRHVRSTAHSRRRCLRASRGIRGTRRRRLCATRSSSKNRFQRLQGVLGTSMYEQRMLHEGAVCFVERARRAMRSQRSSAGGCSKHVLVSVTDVDAAGLPPADRGVQRASSDICKQSKRTGNLSSGGLRFDSGTSICPTHRCFA